MILNTNQFLISSNKNLRNALENLNKIEGGHHRQVLFVHDNKKQIIGALTDGDIRRALIKGTNIESSVTEIMFKNFRYLHEGQTDLIYLIKELKKEEILILPVLNKNKELIEILDLKEIKSMLPIEAVLMAGGEGKRLLPLTENTPKPLLEIGNKPIISYNIDRLKSYGVKKFHFTLNYLGNQIEDFIKEYSENKSESNFVYEKQKLGTAGALALINDFEEDSILVMNSDLLTTIDFEAFYLFFKEHNADMAVASIPYTVKVPYAIMEVQQNKVASFIEKPVFNYFSNAGIYLIKKEVLKLIPKNQFFDATDLMETVIGNKLNLVSFPIRHYWLDIGNPDDFERANEDVKYLNFK